MPADEEPDEENPKVSKWGDFAVLVGFAAVQALIIAWIGGSFMFYTYASNLSNGSSENRADTNVLFNVQLAQTLCSFNWDKTSAADAGPVPEAPAASAPMKGGAWPTEYYCPKERNPVAKAPKTAPTCPFPYTWYPGRKIMEDAKKDSNDLTQTWVGCLKYWWRWGGLGQALTKGKWHPLLAFYARSTALTWNAYRSLLIALFTFTTPGSEDDSPLRKLPQGVVFILSLIVLACSEFIVPIFMVFATLAGFLGLGAGTTIGADGSESEKHQAPGIPKSIRIWFLLFPPNWLVIGIMCGWNALCGMLMFLYYLFFYPIIRDKNLLLASIQCNQELVTLIFGWFVLAGAQATLDDHTVNFMSVVFGVMAVRFAYKSWKAHK